MNKLDINMFLIMIIAVLVIQMGFIIYQYESIKFLNLEVGSLDDAVESLAQELGLTKNELQGKIDENQAKS